MSSCELEIALDEDRPYEIGETVRGQIRVRVDKDCVCRGLTVSLNWRTHGRGNQTAGDSVTVKAFQGTWRAGASHSYPFEIEIPPGPVTYRGHLLNVDHYLSARADIPWGFDPKAEREVLVYLGPKGLGYRTGDDPRLATTPAALSYLYGTCAVVFLLATLYVAGMPALSMLETPGEEWGGIEILAVAAFVTLMLFWVLLVPTLRRRFAESRLGEVTTAVSPQPVAPGAPLTVGLYFSPRASAPIQAIVVTVKGEESVVSGSGTNATTHTQTLFEEQVTLHPGGQVEAGRTQKLQGEVNLPADLPYSFHAASNAIQYTATFHIDIARWPDWTRTVPISLLPC